LRSLVGLCGLILLAALGAVWATGWLWKRYKALTFFATSVLVGVILTSNVYYFRSFFRNFSDNTKIYCILQSTALVEACEWLKPRFDDYDAIIFTQSGNANIIAAVTMGYDPNRWFSEPLEFTTIGEWDYYTRCGKMYFMCDLIFPSMSEFMSRSLYGEQYRPDHVLIIIRPGDVGLVDPNEQIVHKIIGPDGTEALWLCVI
jgi:hypothetical protein